MRPKSTPKITQEECLSILWGHDLDPDVEVCVLGLRGYYLNTMGQPGVNDRGIYDDAMAIIGPEVFVTFNANTDPSVYRKGIAVLKEGVWLYRPGKHGITFNRPGYPIPAFVQAAPVTVIRDGVGEDTGWFGINMHPGGKATTSSAGCQTIVPEQWSSYHATLNDHLKRNKQKTFRYVLTK